MNKLIKTIGLASVLSMASAGAMAGDHHRDYDSYDRAERARVVDVDPIYTYVRVNAPQQECWRESRPDNRHQSYTSTIAGGIIGGVIGNQFGGGSGKTVMTVAGTLLGGSMGRDLGRDGYQPTRYEEHCQVDNHHRTERVLDGYHVTYRYQGKLYTTNMDHHPGKFIPVDVLVKPRHDYY